MIRIALLLFCTALGTFSAAAQAPLRQGIITYALTVDIRKQVEKKQAALASFLPESIHLTIELPFRDAQFAVITKSATANLPGFRMQMDGDEKKRIVDLAARKERQERVINGRSYYTEAEDRPATVSYVAGERRIAGYACRKAIVRTSEGEQYDIWYTTVLPYAYSPKGLELAGLKGAVLAYSSGELSATAVRVSASGFSETSLQANAKARRVTKEQMEDLQEDAVTPEMKKNIKIIKP